MTSVPPSSGPTPRPLTQPLVMPAGAPPASAAARASPEGPTSGSEPDSRLASHNRPGRPSEPRPMPGTQPSVMPAAAPPMSAPAPASPEGPTSGSEPDSRLASHNRPGRHSEPRPMPRPAQESHWPIHPAFASAQRGSAQDGGSGSSPLSWHPRTPPMGAEPLLETPSVAPEIPTRMEPGAREPSAPTIRVSIGRIEVRAIMPSRESTPRTQSSPPAPRLTLEDYLKQWREGKR
jgi:hypothetical protein